MPTDVEKDVIIIIIIILIFFLFTLGSIDPRVKNKV